MAKFTVSIEIECAECGGSVFKKPDSASDDPIIVCDRCEATIGPEQSINFSLNNEAHTVLKGRVVRKVTQIN